MFLLLLLSSRLMNWMLKRWDINLLYPLTLLSHLLHLDPELLEEVVDVDEEEVEVVEEEAEVSVVEDTEDREVAVEEEDTIMVVMKENNQKKNQNLL